MFKNLIYLDIWPQVVFQTLLVALSNNVDHDPAGETDEQQENVWETERRRSHVQILATPALSPGGVYSHILITGAGQNMNQLV